MKNLLLIIITFISTNSYSQFLGDRFIANPIKRVQKIMYVEGKDLSIPDIINDSTTRKIYEERFIYSNNKVSKIETKWFQNDPRITTDSIVYTTSDSIEVFKSDKNRLLTYSRKLLHFNQIYDNLNKSVVKDSTLKIPGLNLTFIIEKGLIKKITTAENEMTYQSNLIYDEKNNIVEFTIERTKSKGEVSNRVQNLNNKDFKLVIVSGNLWCCSEYYYFDKDGYLIKKISESDTNPHIMIFEYENGTGNASEFIYKLADFLTLNPIVH